MRALQALVIVMGIMIVGGIATLGVLIVSRAAHRTAGPAAEQTAVGPIQIPHDAHIEQISVGGDRIVVALALSDGGRRLLILDLSTGRQLHAIELRPAP
ncbi:MAG TPA: DUF6476 family protein [Stellaceae bacterium]|nr:DUF6476 family protein [Stellaceae bacterium]